MSENLVEVKSAALTKATLNWAVAKLEKFPLKGAHWETDDGRILPIPDFSGSWTEGGPIIDREKIDIYQSTGRICAAMWENTPGGGRLIAEAKDCPNALVAAMRCYVASKLGETVMVHKELLTQ